MSAFVGRAQELRILEDLVAAPDDAPAAAVVVGDPGTGKTCLLDELSERAALEHCFRVIGYEPERQIPLSSATPFLQTISRRSVAGRRLAAIVFEDSDRLEPMRVFEAAHRAVDPLEPSLLLVDDLQWVDELSLALCHYLVRAAQAAGQRLVLVAAARPSGQAGRFSAALRHLLPPVCMTEVALGPLSPEESQELVASLAPELDGEVAKSVT